MKYILCRAGGTHSNINKPNNRKIHTNTLFHMDFVEIISSYEGVIYRGLSIASQFANTGNLTKTTNTHYIVYIVYSLYDFIINT